MSAPGLGLAWEDGVLFAAWIGDRSTARTAGIRAVPGEPLRPEDVERALAEAGIPPGPATLALGGDALVVKAVTLPPVPAATRLEILRQEGDRYFLLPEAPRVYGIWEPGDGETWACAASEKVVEDLLELLEAAEIEVRAVTASPAVHGYGLASSVGDGPGASPTAAGKERDASDPSLPGPSLAALGAARADPRRDGLPDLMPGAVRENRRRATHRQTGILAGFVALLLALFVGLWAARQNAQEARLAADLEALGARAQPVVAMRDEIDRITREIVAHRRVVGQEGPVLELLRELSVVLPEDAWLSGLEARGAGEVLLTGYARSAGDVLAGLAASPAIEGVRFDGQATRSEAAGRSVESFRLVVTWKGGPDAAN